MNLNAITESLAHQLRVLGIPNVRIDAACKTMVELQPQTGRDLEAYLAGLIDYVQQEGCRDRVAEDARRFEAAIRNVLQVAVVDLPPDEANAMIQRFAVGTKS